MQEKLSQLVDELESNIDPNSAYLQFTTDNTDDYGAIKANAGGLQLLASQLLKASMRIENGETQPIYFSELPWWISSQNDYISSIIPVTEPRQKLALQNLEKKAGYMKDWGCFLALLVLLFVIVMGCISIVKWIF